MMKVVLACIAALLFAFTLPSVWAGDEESLGGPYSTFDPETGFYTSSDQSATQQPHTSAIPQTDTQLSNPATAIPDEPSSKPSANQPYLMLAGAIVLLAGGLFGFRKYRDNSTNQ